ncbi:MAG: hypothetical protein HZC42_00820 [Candidatus Eisenbacteria bacterium]|nr:hypothetical protein [Candidatus Eisenbacteria bacterium]
MRRPLVAPVLLAACLIAAPTRAADAPPPILVGIEYALPGEARGFAPLGVPAVKPLPDQFTWGKMQAGPDRPVDFRVLDRLVREYQQAGFSEIVLGLKSNCAWGVKDARANLAPRPQHEARYAAWVGAIVERYDGDGRDDMPGLKAPVRWFEVGVEFSSYEPEPVEDYLRMLALAHGAAKAANPDAQVLHAAFLTTTVFRDHPAPEAVEPAYARGDRRILFHPLSSLRAVLDHPELFDALNVHALGDPYEIEDLARWLRWETARRHYQKPLVISDTSPSPFIAWGPATVVAGPPGKRGVVVPPATEADRLRLAAYFRRLLDGDPATVRWVHAFVAEDMAKKVVVAAEQGARLLDTSFMEDLEILKARLFHAAAGNSAWGGMVEVKVRPLRDEREVVELRPSFNAVRQVWSHLKDAAAVRRIATDDPRVRLYELSDADGARGWIAWLEPGHLLLPGDPVPSAVVELQVPGDAMAQAELLITTPGQSEPARRAVRAQGGTFALDLTPTPVFVSAGR